MTGAKQTRPGCDYLCEKFKCVLRKLKLSGKSVMRWGKTKYLMDWGWPGLNII